MSIGDIADRCNWSDVAIHAVDALKCHELRPVPIIAAHQFVKMSNVVMPKDSPLSARATDTLDRRIVVERIRENDTVREDLADHA